MSYMKQHIMDMNELAAIKRDEHREIVSKYLERTLGKGLGDAFGSVIYNAYLENLPAVKKIISVLELEDQDIWCYSENEKVEKAFIQQAEDDLFEGRLEQEISNRDAYESTFDMYY